MMAITNQDGNLVDEMSYDPWGRPRDPDTWQACYRENHFISRGFTGHEHIDGPALINMNSLSRSFIGSRTYDPVLGRFLSPDNYVQLPEFARGYNRYGYCLNNPLKYTDPSGYRADDIADDYFYSLRDIGYPGELAVMIAYHGMSKSEAIEIYNLLYYQAEPEDYFHGEDVGGRSLSNNNSSFGYLGSLAERKDRLNAFGNDKRLQSQFASMGINANIVGGDYYYRTETNVVFSKTNFSSNIDVFNSMSVVGSRSLIGFPSLDDASPQGGGYGWDDAASAAGSGSKAILDNRGAYMPRGQIYKVNKPVTVRTPIVNINTTSRVLNTTRVAGKVCVVAGVVTTGISVYNDIDNGNYYSAGTRAAVYGVAAGAAFIPVVGWGVSIGIGGADAIWGDQFYNWVETKMGD